MPVFRYDTQRFITKTVTFPTPAKLACGLCIIICVQRLLDELKSLPQISHLKGFSLLWVFMSLQAVIRLKPQLTAWPAAHVPLTSLVPADVRSQLDWQLERPPTSRFWALVAQVCLLYTAIFSL
jgi:hypothetical protein